MEQKLDPKKLSDVVSIASPTIIQPKQVPPCFVAGLNFQVGGIWCLLTSCSAFVYLSFFPVHGWLSNITEIVKPVIQLAPV